MSYPRDPIADGTFTWQLPVEEGYQYYILNDQSGIHAGKKIEVRIRRSPPSEGAYQGQNMLFSARRVDDDGTTVALGGENVELWERSYTIAAVQTGAQMSRAQWISGHITAMVTELISLEVDLAGFGFIPLAE